MPLAVGDYLSILGATHSTIKKVCEVVKSVKNAPSEVRDMQTEATYVKSLLEQICVPDQAQATRNASRFLPDLIEEARQLTKAVDAFVDKATEMREDGSRAVKKIRWSLGYGSEAKELARKMREFHTRAAAGCSADLVATVHDAFLPTLCEIHGINSQISDMKQTLSMLVIAVQSQSSVLQHRHPHQTGRNFNMPDEVGPSQVHETEIAGTSQPRSRYTYEYSPRETHSYIPRRFSADDHAEAQSSPAQTRHSTPCQRRRQPPLRQLVPEAARPYIGDIRASPRTLLGLLVSDECTCDDPSCVETRTTIAIVKWYLPRWCAEINATVRLRSCPVQIVIQTPRVVQNACFLGTLDELKRLMATGEVTVNDVDWFGQSLLHHLVLRAVFSDDAGERREMVQYAIESGAPTDWEFWGHTPVQFAARSLEYNLPRLEWAERNIFKPLLDENLDDVYDDLRRVLRWTDLEMVIIQPSTRRSASAKLAEMLEQPHFRSQLNVASRTREGGPLDSAVKYCPDAMEMLLRAGADPRCSNTSVYTAIEHMSGMPLVSVLIRAGAAADIRRGLRLAHKAEYVLELLRHASHFPDWEEKQYDGRTPLETAVYEMKSYSSKDRAFVIDFYRARRLPIGSQLIDNTQLQDGTSEAVTNLKSTSLIAAAVDQDTPLAAIGELIRLGAMVNERDHAGRTLLHLTAMGIVPRGYQVALEVVRHGGFGVDWAALTIDGETAEQLAEETVHILQRTGAGDEDLGDAESVLQLLRSRCLPDGEEYIYPCMHPKFCHRCFSRPCTNMHPPRYTSHARWPLSEKDCHCGCTYDDMNEDSELKIPGAYAS